jgi:hypothetical protein
MSETRMSRRQIVATAAALPLVAAAIGTAEAARQPRMQEALESLRAARNSLERATANKGGHRRKAIDLIDAAIREVKKGIEFAES